MPDILDVLEISQILSYGPDPLVKIHCGKRNLKRRDKCQMKYNLNRKIVIPNDKRRKCDDGITVWKEQL